MTDSMTMTQTAFSGDTTVKKGVPGSTLKLIAIVAMLIDHIGAVILQRVLINNGLLALDHSNIEKAMDFLQNSGLLPLLIVFLIIRLIGRLGFPIFCFLLIEGFTYTRNVWKYAFRLLLFAFISEVPFDLATSGFLFTTHYQNVFFTLFLGLCALIAIKFIEEKFSSNAVIKYLLIVPSAILFMVAAHFLNTDYGAMGVLTIVVMYLLRNNKVSEMTWGCVILTAMSLMEVTAFFTLIPISKYNGERGLNLKYVFYAFYPVHLIILYFIAYFMGIA